MRLLSVAVLASLLPVVPSTAFAATAGTTYYVDSRGGDDAADGTTAATAWKSLEKVAAAELKPGDTVAFKRGGSFTGPLKLEANGTAAQPITVKAYGSGPLAKISGTDDDCVVVNGDHWKISGLRASNCRWAASSSAATPTS
ncbi:hypothetical protein ACFQ0B_60990 [Nonomuraea thailandensis]